MSQEREQQNSSCALFLSILFVLMLFGSGGKDTSVTSHETYHVSSLSVFVCAFANLVWGVVWDEPGMG